MVQLPAIPVGFRDGGEKLPPGAGLDGGGGGAGVVDVDDKLLGAVGVFVVPRVGWLCDVALLGVGDV